MRLRISARKSDLARLQAYMVGTALQKKAQATGQTPFEIEYRFKESLGDINLTDPLWKIPQKGVFTEDFNQELLSGETDLVVHSWKDLPTEIKTETEIVATLPRADQRDLLLVKKSKFSELKKSRQMNIFSSSPRRAYNLTDFLKDVLPFDLQSVHFESVRGNIPTRIRKLLESTETDGLIVAKAALDRLLVAPEEEFAEVQQTLREYLHQLDWMVLPLAVNPNAAAQGALAIEILKSRQDLKKIFTAINDAETYTCAQQEREVLASFGGGCHQKIGIAVLQRPYGPVQILKGLTTAGELLDRHEILKDSSQRFAASAMWPSADQEVHAFQRKTLPFTGLPADVEVLYVSKADAWPDLLVFNKYIWTAGLATWKKLAQKGIWVHGCSEGLGEQEESRIEVLANAQLSRKRVQLTDKLRWFKLTHAEGFTKEQSGTSQQFAATYELIPNGNDFNEITDKQSFYWSSGSLFLEVLKKQPAIAGHHHACGPGHTYDVIRETLQKALGKPGKLEIFLNQHEWRKKCQI